MPFRRHRRWIAFIALLGLLFQQFAMASYVCPVETHVGLAAAGSAELPPCHRQDNADRTRCHEHCHPLTQASDHPPAPTVPAALLPATTWLPEAAQQAPTASDPGALELIARATAPPLTIRDCTFQL